VSLEYAILGFLQNAELSGYDLKTRCFDHDAAHYWTADQAQIYRTLDRLELQGDVTVTPKRQRNKPDRKVYSITANGRTRLSDWAAEPHPLPPYRDPFLIQLRFSDSLDEASIAETLVQRRNSHQTRLEELRDRSLRIPTELDLPRRSKELQRMTLDAAIASERAAIDWLDHCIDTDLEAVGAKPSRRSSARKKGAGR